MPVKKSPTMDDEYQDQTEKEQRNFSESEAKYKDEQQEVCQLGNLVASEAFFVL